MIKSLRKCQYCGIEAWTEEELEKFTKAKKYKYGRRNICKNCFANLIRKGGKYHESHKKANYNWRMKNLDRERAKAATRITIKTKNGFSRIKIGENQRSGVCSECGVIGDTHIHHDEYDLKDPMAHTRELCRSCHARLHRLKEFQQGILPGRHRRINVVESGIRMNEKKSIRKWRNKT